MTDLPKPRLGLNGVGGKSSATIVRSMAPGGTVVTYGGMSRQPVMVPTGSFIFDDIKLKGFWMTRWNGMHTKHERQTMLDELAALVLRGQLGLDFRTWTLAEMTSAVEAAMLPYTGKKEVFLFS